MSIISKDVSSHSFLRNEASICRSPGALIYHLRDNITSMEEQQLYFDKSVVKIKVPDAIVCFDNIDEQTVKDICIDEGMNPIKEVFDDSDLSKDLKSDKVGEPNDAKKDTIRIVVQKISLQELFDMEAANSFRKQDPQNLKSDIEQTKFSPPRKIEEVKLEEPSSTQDEKCIDLDGLNLTTRPCESSIISERKESSIDDILEGSSRDDSVTRKVEHAVNSEIESGINNTNASFGQGKYVLSDNLRDEVAIAHGSSARNCYNHNSHRDLFSGPKYSSAHMAFSGSISHRSDSSTASTRSFAFPILQTEWNSSPVRMAKAECRNRSWLARFVCCKI